MIIPNPSQLLKDNIKALELAFEINTENRKVTDQDILVLQKYSGFGGISAILLPIDKPQLWSSSDEKLFPDIVNLHELIKSNSVNDSDYKELINSIKNSCLSSFYTPEHITDALAESFTSNGIAFNKFLDPCSGTGQFLKSFINNNNQNLSYTAFEKDIATGTILKALYSNQDINNKIHVLPFEKVSQQLTNSFDIVSSNIPFGNFAVSDVTFSASKDLVKQQSCKSIHNYFFIKSLDFIKDGGVLAFMTTESFLNSPSHDIYKRYLMKRCNLISSVRMPSNLFSSTGTNVQTDIIVLQKNSNKKFLTAFEENFILLDKLNDDITIPLIYSDESRLCCTQQQIATNRYGKPFFKLTHSSSIEDIASDMKKVISNDIAKRFNKSLYLATSKTTPKPILKQQAIQTSLFGEIFSSSQKSIPIPYQGIVDSFSYHNQLVTQNQMAGLLNLSQSQPVFEPIEKQSAQIYSLTNSFLKLNRIYQDLSLYESTAKIENPHLRTELNSIYDSLISEHGYLNNKENCYIIRLDAKASELLSLEISNNRGSKYDITKADIFYSPVAFHSFEEKNLSAQDALIRSLDRYGNVDLDFISSISNLSAVEIQKQLNDKILFNPLDNKFELKEYFLSGNIYEKLEKVESKLNLLTSEDSKYSLTQNSFELLKESIPEIIPFDSISFNLGQRWVPDQIYSAFASSLFNTIVDILYLQSNDDYIINCNYSRNNFAINNTYSVSGHSSTQNGLKLLKHAFHNTYPVMSYTFIDDNGNEKKITDNAATQLAKTKIDQIKASYSEYLKTLDVSIKKELEGKYNRMFNNFVKPNYDGSHLSFSDLNLKGLGIESLYDTQKNAVWMQVCNRGALIDHEVSGGKTLIMCIAAHEMKRLGICNKPMITGLKSNIIDIANTYKKAYPNDKLLFVTDKDFNKKTRQEFLSKIQNNNWDCIILTHDQYKAIPHSPKVQLSVAEDELRNLSRDLDLILENQTNLSDSKRLIFGLEKRKENLNAKIDSLNAVLAQKKDNVVDFDKMGIDHIFVDESHLFKNLTFTTRHQRVAGLGSPAGSERSLNLLYGIRTIQEKKNSDLCATFLSGTPISNSITELYLIFKYLTPNKLKKQQTPNFDSWAANFALKSVDFEFSVTNEIIAKERFRHFINVPELAAHYNEFADYKSAKMIGFERPSLDTELVKLSPDEQQKDFSQRLIEFARTGDATLIDRGPLSSNEDKGRMLIATNTAKKMALDMRLISDSYEDSPENKINQAASKLHEFYIKSNADKGTQLVFSDLGVYKKDSWNVYEELKNKLIIDYSIPSREIAFIQESVSESQKTALFKKVNDGEIRFLFGSTAKLGTGTNVQKRIVAMHHLDIPWKPSCIQQRNGRGARAGNEIAKKFNNSVKNFVYATTNTLDVYKFNLVQTKELFINQIKQANINVRTLDEGSMEESTGMPLAEIVALLSGDNNLLNKAKLEKEISALEGEKNAYYKEQNSFDIRLAKIDSEMGSINKNINNYSADAQMARDCPQVINSITDEKTKKQMFVTNIKIDSLKTNSVKDIGEHIMDIAKTNTSTKATEIGRIGELSINVRLDALSNQNIFAISGKFSYRYQDGIINSSYPLTVVRHFQYSLDNIVSICNRNEKKLDELTIEKQNLLSIKDKPWPKEKDLQEKKNDLSKVINDITRSLDEKKNNQKSCQVENSISL